MAADSTPRFAVFPDTNVWLHFKPAREVDWCALTGAPSVRLVVCGQVLDELDEKKYDSRLSDRATRALAAIKSAALAGGELRLGVDLVVVTESPDAQGGNADEVIIRATQAYAATHAGTAVAIATADLGMELRCRSRGVKCFNMPGDLRLPLPQDEVAKRHSRALEELATIKGRLPQLVVLARPAESEDDLSSELDVVLHDAAELEDVETSVRQAQHESPPLGGPAQPLGLTGLYEISDAERKKYNSDLEHYYKRVRAHTVQHNEWLNSMSRTVLLEIVVENRGGGPAEDVLAELRWPEYIEAVAVEVAEDKTCDRFFLEPVRPPPPEAPRSVTDMFGLGHDRFGLDRFHFQESAPEAQRVTAVMDGDNHGVTVRIRKLNHHLQESLGVCAMRFAAWPDVKPFEISYRLVTASHPERIEGRVLVRASTGPRRTS